MTDERIVSPETNETEELIENHCVRSFSRNISVKNKVKEELSIYIQAAKIGKKHWIMCCFTDHLD